MPPLTVITDKSGILGNALNQAWAKLYNPDVNVLR